jgi:hypothetical protein
LELRQLYSSLEQVRAAVQIGRSGLNATVPSQSFEQMDGNALVGQVG